MAKTYAMGLISALAASASSSLFSQTKNNVAFADGPFNFPSFSSTSGSPQSSSGQSPSQPSASPAPTADKESSENVRVRNNNPRTSSAGFDPEALERGAEALREISKSPNAKKVLFLFIIFCCFRYVI